MATLTPDQVRTRERVESVIRLMAPAMNIVLQAGERLSRMVEPDDPEYYPPRSQRTDEDAPKTSPHSSAAGHE